MLKLKNIAFTAAALFLFGGCTSKELTTSEILKLPQDIHTYTKGYKSKVEAINKNKFHELYFSVWNKVPQFKLKEIVWPFSLYKYGESYGENLQLLKKSFFTKMKINSNFENFMSVKRKAITVEYSDIRSFPTKRPLFHNPSLAGEGFPFDYLQNSTIQANKPIFVSHYSKDKQWAYIFSSFAYGWVKTEQIALLNDEEVKKFKNSKHAYIIKDNIALKTQSGDFLFKSKIGTLLPIIDENETSYTLEIIKSSFMQKPLFLKTQIDKKYAKKDFILFNMKNLNMIIGQLSDSKYGWGGMYAQRDCSSTLRDMYIPFGIWLPRNSSQQANIGKVISFDGMNNDTIEKTIKKYGVPFKTLLHKKGHIMLYVGIYNNKIVIFHNAWGIKIKRDGNEGRFVIGKAIFSTLKVGNNLPEYDKSAELLKNLKSMNILTQ